MTNPTTPEAPEVSEEQRAAGLRFAEIYAYAGDEEACAKAHAQALAQESAREARAWETLIRSGIQAGEIRKHLHPVALGAVIAALKALLDEIPKARAKIQEGT